MHLSTTIKVTVLTRANNRPVIEAAIKEEDYPNLQFIYFDIPVLKTLKKKIPFGVQLYFLLWEYFSYQKLRHLKADIIQRMTFVSSVSAFRAYKLNIPYIFGFVAGGERTPDSIFRQYPFKYRVLETIRNIYNVSARFCFVVRKSIFSSVAAIAVTQDSMQLLSEIGYQQPVFTLPAIGIEKNVIETRPLTRTSETFKIVYAGSLIYLKNVDIALKAISLANIDNLYFDIFGEGKERKSLETLAKALDLARKVAFKGHVPRKRLLENVRQAHVFIFPSSHDSGGFVLLEALAKNVPVLFLNTGGPREIFRSANYPLKVDPNQSYLEIVRSFADKIIWLHQNYDTFMEEFQDIRQQVLDRYLWENKALEMLKIYETVLNENSANPQ